MGAKHYFAAANTGAGFYNCFDGVNDPCRESFVYVLKGGPGTGKSTLMKKVGGHFEGLGEEAEYFRCASDGGSLDGVRLPRINTAVLDGTAPHTLDPALPAVTGAVIDLGAFIGPEVKEHGKDILKAAARKKEGYDAACAYIRAAAALDAANLRLLASATRPAAVKDVAGEIARRLFGGRRAQKPPGKGRERRLFLSAVGGGGRVSLEALNGYGKVIRLLGNAFAAGAVISELAAAAGRAGRSLTSFCSLLSPDSREALQIPDQGDGDAALVKAGQQGTPPPSCAEPSRAEAVNLEDTLIKGRYSLCRDGILYGCDTVEKLLGLAARELKGVQAAHREIEGYYIPAMDFCALDRAAERLVAALSHKLRRRG